MIGAIVVVALAIGAGAVLLLGGDDDDSPGGGDDARTAWNAIAVVDFRSGDVTVLDRDGEEVDTIDSGLSDPRAFPVGSSMLAVLGDDGDSEDVLALVDVVAGTSTRVDLPDDVSPRPLLNEAGVPLMIAGDPNVGPAYLIDAGGEVLDVAAAAGWDEPFIDTTNPLVSPDGTRIALSNLRENPLATVVVSFDPDVEPVVVPGRAVALGDDDLVTFSPDRERGTIERFDGTGDSLGAFETDAVRAVLDAGDGTLLTLDVEGVVERVDVEVGSSDRVDRLDVTFDANAVRVPGPDAALLILQPRDDGRDLFVLRADGTTSGPIELGDDGGQTRTGLADECAAIVAGSELVVVDLPTGEVTASADTGGAAGIAGSADMCTAIAFGGDEDAAVIGDEAVTLPEGQRFIGVSPDGEVMVVRTDEDDERTVRLVTSASLTSDGDDTDPVELGPLAGFLYFVQR